VSVRHLWLVALVALCMGAAGAAQAGDGYAVISHDLPATLEWEATAAGSVLVDNTGTTAWGSSYVLRSVVCPTAAARLADQWGLTSVPITGVTVPPEGQYLFSFDVVAPPITPLRYALPLTPTQVATAGSLPCDWMLMNGDTLIGTDAVEHAITLSRFSDVQPGTAGAWARFWIEECAGRVPLIAAGFGGNDYRPTLTVTRDQMAVYMARALNLPTAAYEGIFPDDVPASQWAWPWIEALQRAGIVQGFDATHYGPAAVVNRDAMAVYVARGMEGGIVVPSGPVTATFTDVPIGFWAYDEVEYCVAHNVVSGYSPTIYEPTWPVTRDQMTVFVYRGFIQPTGTAVVWAGPAISAAHPGIAEHLGWSSSFSGPSDDPGTAYLLLDAARLSPDMAPLDITFELLGPETPTPTATDTLDATEIQTAIDNVSTQCGCPFLLVRWELPTGLATGEYTLVVTIGGYDVPRRFAYTITD